MRLGQSIVLALASLGAAAAQPAAFEVASVKPAGDPGRQGMVCLVPCTPGERLTFEGSRVDIRNMSLERLILTAYAVKSYQLSGPEWMNSTRFDIAAKAPAGFSKDRLPEMLQALLAERFKLAIHQESKELPVYGLIVGKSGAKLQASPQTALEGWDAPGSSELYTPEGEARMLAGGGFAARGGPFGALQGGILPGRGGLHFEFLNLTMPGLAILLTPHLDRPVVDQTGLKGSYHLDLQIHALEGDGRKGDASPGGEAAAGPRPDHFGDSLIGTIEKAGLKLEKTKAAVEMIVVDHLEKTPTAN